MTFARNVRRCAFGAAALGSIAAVASSLALAGVVRDLVPLSPDAASSTPAAWFDIAVTNGRIAAATLLLAAVRSRLAAPAAVFADLLVVVVLGANACLIGAAMGAYGSSLCLLLLPHLPLEAAALTLCGGTYLSSRVDSLTTPLLGLVAVTSAVLLVLAALVEVHVQLGAES